MVNYLEVLISFLRKKDYQGYKIDSYITPIILKTVEDCMVSFFSSKDVQEKISAHIIKQFKENEIIGKLVRKDISEEGKALLKSTLESQIGKRFANVLIAFFSTAIGQQVISFIHAHITGGMVSALAHQISLAVSHSVIGGVLKSTIISMMSHVGITALIHTKIGLIIGAILAGLGIAAKASVVLVVIAPVILGILAYQYIHFPKKLAEKLGPEVATIIDTKFDEITLHVVKEITSATFENIFSETINKQS